MSRIEEVSDILISKKELIDKIESARNELHKDAKDLEGHYSINCCVDSFLKIVESCKEIEN